MSHEELGTIDGIENPLLGGLSKGSKSVFTRVSEKTTENSERLDRQARLGIESGISRQPVLSVEPRSHWWGQGRTVLTVMPYPGFEPGSFGAAAGSPSHYTPWSAWSSSKLIHVQNRVRCDNTDKISIIYLLLFIKICF